MIDLADAKEAFALAVDAENQNRIEALEDLRFVRLDEQWPEAVKKLRGAERPMLTINKSLAFVRQVVNDARQNRPSIKVMPVDSGADPETARILGDLIRNIEAVSNADVAYDTAVDFAVTMGWGYWRIDVDYAYDDTFDRDILIRRVGNPFSVYADPRSVAADSSDWMYGFVTEPMSRDEFAKRFPDAAPTNWDSSDYARLPSPWKDGEDILVAEYWHREEVVKTILKLTDGRIVSQEDFEKDLEAFQAAGLTPTGTRDVKSFKVTQAIMTGAEILEEKPWEGCYIPIVPVYGDEVNVEGVRHFRSLIRPAKDAQRQYNYWSTVATELVALAPKAPYIGPEEAFSGEDSHKWADANEQNYSYIAYAGQTPPQRQPFAMPPAGALQETLKASDDMKAILGMYDASLGQRSNETSGKAIMARQREGDTSTYHFLDNLNRAIRHTGKILLDLIPKVYTGERVIRVVGQDGETESIQLNTPTPVTDKNGQPMMQQGPMGPVPVTRIYTLDAGKYDLVSSAGPNFTTRRQEAAEQMTAFIQAYPDAAVVIGDLLVKNLDWPGAEEIAERLKGMVPPGATGPSPEMQQMAQQLQQVTTELQQMKADQTIAMGELQIKGQEIEIKRYEAETDRMKVKADAILREREASKPQPIKSAA